MRPVLMAVFALLVSWPGMALAHPVSQGAMNIVIYSDRVVVRATVSSEEVFVAAAAGAKTGSPIAMLREHGDYLLAHLRVTGDGRPLVGRVTSRPELFEERPTYELEFAFEPGPLARLVFEEDVLREFEFAPGNRWEASYFVRIHQDGQLANEGLLLTHRRPLEFACRWSAAPPDDAASAPRMAWGQMARAFINHGIMHILGGYDHLLFVGALLLAVASLWDLIKVITSFTLAHTITLTVSALGIFRLPGFIVEPMIAASIVIVALQNVLWPENSRGRGRLLVAFGFGLFHGLGFAGGLIDAMSGLSSAAITLAIASFCVGVEIGHQLVVLPLFAALQVMRRAGAGALVRDRNLRRYGSVAISLFGLLYFVVAIQVAVEN
jgi:HupE / UreJ protein